jgi:hypothetical protein
MQYFSINNAIQQSLPGKLMPIEVLRNYLHLLNPKIHYCVRKNPCLCPNFIQLNSVCFFTSHLSNNRFKFFFSYVPMTRRRGGVVGIANDYGLDNRGVGVRVPLGSRIFSSPYRPDRFWGPPSLLSNGYRGIFPRG